MEDKRLTLHLLIEKYKLLWSHYKLQNEMAEKKRHFLWLIESALFIGWFKTLSNFTLINLLIISVGIIISFCFFYTLRRGRESMFLTEKELRDVECEFIKFTSVEFDKFSNDKIAIGNQREVFFEHSRENFNEEEIKRYWRDLLKSETKHKFGFFYNINEFINPIIQRKYRSERLLLDFLNPLLFIFSWFVLLFIYYPILFLLSLLILQITHIKNNR